MGDFLYRVLVVDDDERIRRVSEGILAGGGYEVRTAADGFEALALMRKAPPDLLISDLKMPNMSGFELLSIVRRRFPQIPVIAITGEFSGGSGPAGLLADALFHKGEYSPKHSSGRFGRYWRSRPFGRIFRRQTGLRSGYHGTATTSC